MAQQEEKENKTSINSPNQLQSLYFLLYNYVSFYLEQIDREIELIFCFEVISFIFALQFTLRQNSFDDTVFE